MGFRLLILGWKTPNFIIQRELENISDKTATALNALSSKYGIETVGAETQERQRPKTLDEQRAAMAQTQAKLVETLANALGHDAAVKLGRKTLFSVGQNLGKQARSSLGVSDNPKDLTRAAKILYRILGIEFHLEWHDKTSATLVIDKCALAEHYSKTTCEVLSATDEGVINGLQPRLTMNFKEYMTAGCKNCRADISLDPKEIQA